MDRNQHTMYQRPPGPPYIPMAMPVGPEMSQVSVVAPLLIYEMRIEYLEILFRLAHRIFALMINFPHPMMMLSRDFLCLK